MGNSTLRCIQAGAETHAECKLLSIDSFLVNFRKCPRVVQSGSLPWNRPSLQCWQAQIVRRGFEWDFLALREDFMPPACAMPFCECGSSVHAFDHLTPTDAGIV